MDRKKYSGKNKVVPSFVRWGGGGGRRTGRSEALRSPLWFRKLKVLVGSLPNPANMIK